MLNFPCSHVAMIAPSFFLFMTPLRLDNRFPTCRISHSMSTVSFAGIGRRYVTFNVLETPSRNQNPGLLMSASTSVVQ